ncbi:MAG: hypothetical protein EPO01_05695 [Aquabacterium sp.]|nr:MAG: hypothetical protein EPO01_05695 [Aquabacterium sp.]
MSQLLLVTFIVAVLFIAPLKTAAVFFGGLLLATLVVQATAAGVGRTPVTLGEALRAIVLSVFFSFVAMVTIWSFTTGGAMHDAMAHGTNASRLVFGSVVGLGLMAFQAAAFFLGFRVALGLPFLPSALVAVVSTVIVGAALWVGTSLLA